MKLLKRALERYMEPYKVLLVWLRGSSMYSRSTELEVPVEKPTDGYF